MIELSQLHPRTIAADDNPTVADPRTSPAFETVGSDIFDQIEVRFGDGAARADREAGRQSMSSQSVTICDDPMLEVDERYVRNRGGR